MKLNTEKLFREIVRQEDGRNKNDIEVKAKRDHVRGMMIHAWTGYETYAWGFDELRPVTKSKNDRHGHDIQMGTTIIDGMDTLYIMGLEEMFHKGRKWIEESFDLSQATDQVSVFETNIRFVGG